MNAVSPVETLVTDHLDLWTAALKRKSTAGRGSSSKVELYGIKKLRELILELAVRGLLVPQDPNDEPASELLKKIAAEKAKLVKAGRIKKEKPQPPIGDEEMFFSLPKGWAWIRNASLFGLRKGKVPKDISESGDIPYLDIEALDRGNVRRYTNDISIPRATSGDLLVVCDGSRSGLVLDGKDGAIGSTLSVIETPKFIQGFVKLLFLHGFERLNSAMKGAAIPHLDTVKLLSEVTGLPPLTEQHRIVAKVDELMALCDQLEQQTDASLGAHQTLVEILLNALTSAADHAQFASAWQRIAGHFDTLFATEESIAQLKQTILQLAVMGKLVPQDPNDEPASELLKKIAAEKASLLKAGEVKKEKPLPPVSEDEKPFILPERWAYSHLQEICLLITDGTHQTPTYTSEGRPFISAQCIKPFRFIPENCRYVSEEDYQEYIKNRKPERGDILLSRVGAGIGEAALIDQDLDFAIYVSTGLLKLPNAYFLSEYMVLWLNAPIGRYFSTSRTLGKGVSQGNLNLSLIRTFVVSVPPLNEQHRIIAKVDELMSLCDQLKSRLSDAQTTQLHLADALVEQAIG